MRFEDKITERMRKLPVPAVTTTDKETMWTAVERRRGSNRSNAGTLRRSFRGHLLNIGVSVVAVLAVVIGVGVYLQKTQFGGTTGHTKTSAGQTTLDKTHYDVEFWPLPQKPSYVNGPNPQLFAVYVGQWPKSLTGGPVIVATTTLAGVRTASTATTAQPGAQVQTGTGPGGFNQAINTYLKSQHLAPVLSSKGGYVSFQYNKLGGVVPAQFNLLANASGHVAIQDWRLELMQVVHTGGDNYRVLWGETIKPRFNVGLLQALRAKLGPNAHGVVMPWYKLDGALGFALVEYTRGKQPYFAQATAELNDKGTWQVQSLTPISASREAKAKVESQLHAPVVPMGWSGELSTTQGIQYYQVDAGIVDVWNVVKVRLTYNNGETTTILVRNGLYATSRSWLQGQGQHQSVVKGEGLNRLGSVVFSFK